MNTGKTLFAQIMDFLPWSTFDRIVARYEGSDRLEIRERGARPTNPQPFAEYFPTTRATSSSLAKSPRSAAAIPASILPICQAFSAT